MGGAASIENTLYDEDKFLQSKAIMESTANDAEKFSKLKSIWTDGVPPGAADAHHNNGAKEVPPAETGTAHEGHKEEIYKDVQHNGEINKAEHRHNGDHHCHKEEHRHKAGEQHAHNGGDHANKEGEHHHTDSVIRHKEGEKNHSHHKEGEHHEHKGEEEHKEGDHALKVEFRAAKEDGVAEAPKDPPKVPSGSASTGKLPSASSEIVSEKVSKEV
ncbi:hypothetical protein GN244_ATG04803 [Phytophthora infestans]|uniref:Uncharacterized protein n=1 Tax=Phytophthora infestans TaxID=4787 RepID=A0A833TGQ2_PHYIN|nr:hypothetical protein GN244_ATG04803 [Phytophthora infestans]KAF4138455.1 hypothetical protein GN958_ATG12321 [Phytophthora infestans]